MFKTYFLLTKPGIIIGNLITCAAGFFLASAGRINLGIFAAVLSGTTLIIASSCVINNLLDRKIDEKMERTKKRALVVGSVTSQAAITYATVLGVIGFTVLYLFTNILTVLVGAVGVFFYVVMYSIWKRRSVFSTIIGSVSGAIPPVAGYTAVRNHIDAGAIILFIILVLWQMPHFYSIAIYRLKDYAAAKIPVLPVKSGIKITKIHILFYIIAFIAATISLTAFGYAGYFYLVVGVVLGIYWLKLAFDGFKAKDDKVWARHIFKFSLKLITILCIMIAIDAKM